jgi:hypothetical protein
MRQLVRQRQSVVNADQGLIRVPQQPEGYRGKGSAGNTRIVAKTERRRTTLVWRVVCNACL